LRSYYFVESLSSIKATYQVFDTASGPPVLLVKTDNIRTFVVTDFIISSSSGNQTTVSVFLVPPGGVAAQSNAVLNGYKIAANSYIEGKGGFVLQPGGWAIYVSCDTGSACSFTVSGDLGAVLADNVT
jgi:hypothetical protein